jgi:site-specific DNA recombinase
MPVSNRIISDTLTGKIDLIITKPFSRFARNTVDFFSTIRKLKDHNIECYSENRFVTFKGETEITVE